MSRVAVDFVGGLAKASSETGSHPAQRAFQGHAWKSDKVDGSPEIIWYDFKDRSVHCPAEITFRPWSQVQSGATKNMPGSFEFVGSNDQICGVESTWSPICENRSKEPLESLNERRGCAVKNEAFFSDRAEYRCLGVRIRATLEPAAKVALADIKIKAFGFCK